MNPPGVADVRATGTAVPFEPSRVSVEAFDLMQRVVFSVEC